METLPLERRGSVAVCKNNKRCGALSVFLRALRRAQAAFVMVRPEVAFGVGLLQIVDDGPVVANFDRGVDVALHHFKRGLAA